MRLIFSLSLLMLLASCGSVSSPDLYLQPVAHFAPNLRETSGLIRWQQHFISHNDSGNAPELFVLDSDGRLVSQLTVTADNHDWEDIAARGDSLYLADTGNNEGRRRDLSILVLSVTPTVKQTRLTPVASLAMAYAEQTHFQPAPYQHNFDAEALTWVQDELWLFTKRWLDQTTAIYKVPTAEPSNLAAKPSKLHAQQQLNPQMLVTGADFDEQTATLILLGYSRSWFNRQAWIWLYPVQHGQVREHLGRQFTLNEKGQFEGISLGDDGFIYVTREGRGTNLFRTDQTLSQLLINLR